MTIKWGQKRKERTKRVGKAILDYRRNKCEGAAVFCRA